MAPVDAGYAELLKVKVRQAHYQWLDLDENADKWYGEENRFTASESHILITQWVGETYKLFWRQSMPNLGKKLSREQSVFLLPMDLEIILCNLRVCLITEFLLQQ